jgi:hypothetical protein
MANLKPEDPDVAVLVAHFAELVPARLTMISAEREKAEHIEAGGVLS